MDRKFNFQEFHGIIATLRSENGCPWDRAQTHESLKGGMLEEAYEVVQAIDDLNATNDPGHLKEELGDVLLQIFLHSQIAEEYGEFTLEDVVDGIARKMIHRHPHVFGGKTYANREEQSADWEKLKSQEEGHAYQSPGEELKEVPAAFPALIRGQKVMKKALRHEMVSNTDEDIFKEMLNSMVQLQVSAAHPEDADAFSEKMGQTLMAILKLAAKYKINAEMALTEEIEKFIRNQQP